MSHFVVLADIGPDVEVTDKQTVSQAVEEALAPFYEGLDVEPYRIDVSEHDQGSLLFSVSHEPYRLLSTAAPRFEKRWQNVIKTPKEYRLEAAGQRSTTPEQWQEFIKGYDEELGKLVKLYTPEEIAGYHNAFWEYTPSDSGEYWHLDQHGIYSMTSYNPGSKWDWYSIGGRWLGFFKLRRSVLVTSTSLARHQPEAVLGESGVGTNEASFDSDVAKASDIDWDAMKLGTIQMRKERWEEAVASGKPRETWFVWGIEENETEESYVNKVHVAPYAYLDYDGEWYQKGQMGWFGVGSDEESEDAWSNRFEEWVSQLPEDHVLVAVDCHI